jgi:branched-chain amino acid transport system substrate-binding protein
MKLWGVGIAAFIIFNAAVPAQAQKENQPVKIGVITSLDPVVAPWSDSANICLRQAAAEINKAGGIKKRRLELIFEDDRFLPKNALSAYHKLRNIDKVDFIIGPQFDQTMAAVSHLANKDKQLLISTIGTNPVNKEQYGYIIHAYPPDKFAGQALARRIIEDRRRKVAFIVPEESYSQNFANFVLDNLLDVEYQWFSYKPEIEDYKPLLLKAKYYRPDALIFLFLLPDTAAHIYRKMRELDIRLPIYTSETLHAHKQFLKEAGHLAEPTIYYIVDFDEKNPEIQALLDSLPEKPTLPLYCIVAYDTLHWLAELIKENGTNNETVKNAIYKMKYKGLFTTYEFDQYGDFPTSHWVSWRVTSKGYVRDQQ